MDTKTGFSLLYGHNHCDWKYTFEQPHAFRGQRRDMGQPWSVSHPQESPVVDPVAPSHISTKQAATQRRTSITPSMC
eukprot:9256066-Prorocentrum_lima.AAC.1